MKNIENFIIKETKPLTTTSWNNLIKEDHKNANIKIYDESLFMKAKCFKVVMDNDEEDNIEEEKIKKEEEEKKKKFEDFLEIINLFSSNIEKSSNEIKRDMEEDQKKREELEIQEKMRREQERKRREELERKRKEEQEKKSKEEQERKRKEEQERKNRKAQTIVQRDRQIDADMRPIHDTGFSIKERLINAGNNYQNIINEVKKINENRSLKKISDKILQNINEINSKLSTKTDINKSTETFIKLLNELKSGQYQDLYLYACFQILATLSEKLYNMSISSQNYEKYFIVAKIISKINSKTLTYMLYQRISFICPYIIPFIYTQRDFPDKETLKKRQGFLQDDTCIKDVNNRLKNYEYLYFIFLWLDADRNINILEDYINNIEIFKPVDINYLISNSFLCFIDVFGNYIYNKKKNWLQRIINIQKKILEGLELSNKNTNNSEEKNINGVIIYKIKDFMAKINKNRPTKFMENMNK